VKQHWRLACAACWSQPLISKEHEVSGHWPCTIRSRANLATRIWNSWKGPPTSPRLPSNATVLRRALQKAFEEIKNLKDKLYEENLALREEVDQASMFEEIIGTSPALQEVLSRVAKVAPSDSTVLITGETGTGKELVARAIHKRSQRAGRAFVSVKLRRIPPS